MAKVKFIQWRSSDNEILLAKKVSADYGVNVSELLRMALQYVDEHRPILTKTVTSIPQSIEMDRQR